MISFESLCQDLKKMGIQQGDVVLVRGDLGKVGRAMNLRSIVIDSLLKAVGEQGTIVGLSFTKAFDIKNVEKDYIFDVNTSAITGALAKSILAHPEAIRSTHPINSFVAIGVKAKEILEGHNENQLPFYPMEKIVKMNGKMLIFGCVADSPGFTTVHRVQEELGLSKKSKLANKRGVFFKKNGEVSLFKQDSIGGCSKGFSKFYTHYVINEKLITGYYGKAYAILISAKDAYDIEHDILKKVPTFALCNDPLCHKCRTTWRYNRKDIPLYFFHKAKQKIKKILR